MQNRISEIFVSIQGEGTLVGARQIFVRFVGCNLHCEYCDTPFAKQYTGEPNPLDVSTLLKLREETCANSISWTGGEPLLHTEFLSEIMPVLKQEGFSQYLETNGTLSVKLEEIIEYCDYVAADYKPFVDFKTSMRFAEVLKSNNTDGCFKLVVDNETSPETLARAASCAKTAALSLVLMPVVGSSSKLSGEKLMEYQKIAMDTCKDVRVILRQHELLGLK